ncbi:YolD-like family protein [Neobacillus dielmonensis]|uniref:YolD-like family protein n=1 Tax=Neobacillus dielmonensis TaxID=1347369 RepID=UPI0005A7476F|nr:YolD-like family protein [Neobacillus dielmonensis]
MYLKKLTQNEQVTVEYISNGVLKTFKGRVSRLNLSEQKLSLVDEKKISSTIRLANIRNVY